MIASRGEPIAPRRQRVSSQSGGFMALVDLPDGKSVIIALGSAKFPPRLGQARAILFDGLGLPRAAATDPARGGALHFPGPP